MQDANSNKSVVELLLNICVNCVGSYPKYTERRFIAQHFSLKHRSFLLLVTHIRIYQLANESNPSIANPEIFTTTMVR